MKKAIAFITVLSLLGALLIPQLVVNAAPAYNYGEALQKAIMFYEFQRAGELPDDTRNNWRGDSALTDGSDVGLDLTGGWFDAGDHVKFNLPMAYTATMLAWSVYESRDAYVKSGQLPYILDNIKWATDYFIRCHPSPNVYYYQVGDGAADHAWWGPAEVMQMKRPSFKVDTATPGSTVAGETAAALAAAAIIFEETDPGYAATCLKHAKELFTFADTTKSDDGYKAAQGYYASWSGYYDELTWASAWLYLATDDSSYLDKAASYEPYWERELGTDTIKYKWGHCWDNKLFGSMLLLARATNEPLYKECIERNLDWWTTGYGGSKIKYTPEGLAWLDTWGSLRYATTTAFLASVYAEWAGADPAKAEVYREFAKSQVDYALGSAGRSYVVGFGTNPPQHPHHRTAHGGWEASMNVPAEHRHILYGALVGGPDASDSYTDSINDYISNEVACDYNAGFVGILAKMYGEYGGTPIENFEAFEKVGEEFSIIGAVNASGATFINIRASLCNKTGWPARSSDKLSYRYFIDISEAVSAGYDASDITVQSSTSNGAKVSQLIPWDAERNVYYVKVDFTGTNIYPGGINDYKRDVYFSINAPQGFTGWDNLNDYSFEGLSEGGHNGVITDKIPVYDDGHLVYGQEPAFSGVSPKPTPSATPSISPTPTPTGIKYGDVNSDGAKNSIDFALMRMKLLGMEVENFYEPAGDVNLDGRFNSIDFAYMRQYLLGMIPGLPV